MISLRTKSYVTAVAFFFSAHFNSAFHINTLHTIVRGNRYVCVNDCTKGPFFRKRMSLSESNSMLKKNQVDYSPGDYLSIDMKVTTDPEDFPVSTAFDQGVVHFCVGDGGFMPGIHDMARNIAVGDTKTETISGGEYNEAMSAQVPIENAPAGLKIGDILRLSNGLKVRVTKITDTAITIDANKPTAGKSFRVQMQCLDRKPSSGLLSATFAAGCFWGLELAFQRVPGVAFTAVGYTHGEVENPSYEAVCSGSTGHAEAVTVLYDPVRCDYATLLETFWNRHDPTQKNRQGNDIGTQYRGGIYYHSEEQRKEAEDSMVETQKKYQLPLATELRASTSFWMAEDYHQQYLEKGGQSAKKQSSETIRCYG